MMNLFFDKTVNMFVCVVTISCLERFTAMLLSLLTILIN